MGAVIGYARVSTDGQSVHDQIVIERSECAPGSFSANIRLAPAAGGTR